jgi:hypothetical protein
MLESGESLNSWALLELPRGWQAAQSHTALSFPKCMKTSEANLVEVERLGDHRREYLEYEGPLSGERGRVTRIDAGSFVIIDESPQCWRVELRGRKIQGQVALEAGTAGAGKWTLALVGAD